MRGVIVAELSRGHERHAHVVGDGGQQVEEFQLIS
jgi:hypothetical protein